MSVESNAQRTVADWSVERGPSGSDDPAAGGIAGEMDSQINIKGDRADIERFRRLAKRDGYRLIGLLRRALDAYEREMTAGYIHFRR